MSYVRCPNGCHTQKVHMCEACKAERRRLKRLHRRTTRFKSERPPQEAAIIAARVELYRLRAERKLPLFPERRS